MRTSRSRTDAREKAGVRLAPTRSCTYRLMKPVRKRHGWFELSRGASIRTRVSCTPGSAPTMFEVEDDFVKRRGVPSGRTVYRIGRYRALLAELASGSCSESRTGEPAWPGRPQQSIPLSGGVLPPSRHRALCFRSERERPV